MRFITTIISILCLSFFVGCSYEEIADRFIPKEEAEFAKRYLENLRLRNFDQAKKYLSPELISPNIDAKLNEIAAYFPEGEPIEVKTIGSNVFTSSDKWQANLSFQYQFGVGWAVANVVLVKDNEEIVVKGVHVNRIPQSLEVINSFTIKDKSITHYLFLILAIAIPLFIIYSLVLCIKTPMMRKKWLWVILVLIGFVGFSLNWTTGQISIQPISFRLLGASAFAASPFAPWVITVSIPIGAVLFLIKRSSFLNKNLKQRAN